MTTTDSRQHVPTWPRVSATVDAHGAGELAVNGVLNRFMTTSSTQARIRVIAHAARTAQRLNRPVRLEVADQDTTHALAVRPNGIVQPLATDGYIDASVDLAPHESPCLNCGQPQAVSVGRCEDCGHDSPHGLEPPSGAVGDADSQHAGPAVHVTEAKGDDELEQTRSIRSTAPEPDTDARLRLTFSTQEPVEMEARRGAAIGRKPEAVGGRTPITVSSPARMLSRTHVLIDYLDGRIIVTDYDSGNGTQIQGDPPTELEPGAGLDISPGSILVAGDVVCRVEIA